MTDDVFNSIKARVLAQPGSTATDLALSLVAEIERLQGERDHFREAWAKAQVRIDCGSDATEAIREERAAAVAHLRAKTSCLDTCCKRSVLDLVGDIERGERHREEGKP